MIFYCRFGPYLLVCRTKCSIAMPARGYKVRNQSAVHFISFAVVEWVDVFTRPVCQNIILDSLKHCHEKRGLVLNAWCLMSNHILLVASAKNNDLSAIHRDFKSFTSNQIIKSIQENKQESRKDWMLSIFRRCGKANSRNKEFQFWRQDNQPKECFTTSFTMQKINYIHQNPVVAGLVNRAEDYRLSSAINYASGRKDGLLEVDLLLSNLREHESSS